MKLSTNLTLSEVIKSNTATRNNISNEPTKEHLQNLVALAENIFQPIREHFNAPIYLNSGYRSEALNKAVGGSKTSQHCKGEAIDIDNDFRNSVSNKEIFDYARTNLDFDQLIFEGGTKENPAWVHISYKIAGNRKQVLRMKDQKITIYED